MLKTIKHLIASGRGDTKRLRDIMNTVKQGNPLLLSDYRYIEEVSAIETKPTQTMPPRSSKRDESVELLRIRLAEGKITIDEYRELKNALTEE